MERADGALDEPGPARVAQPQDLGAEASRIIMEGIRETLHGAEPSIVATGPNAPVIARYCRNRVVYDKYLLMEGLYTIYQKNCK